MKEKLKQYKRQAIAMAVSAIVLLVVVIAVPEAAFSSVASMKIACGLFVVICTALAALFAYKYFKIKKEIEKAALIDAEEEAKAAEELGKWLDTDFAPFARVAAELVKTDKAVFSRFGGLPLVPENFVWPTCDGKPIPFLLQLDFSEINGAGALENFPTEGLLYVFVDGDKVDFADEDSAGGDYTYKEGRTFKILFFERTEKLTEAEAPENPKVVYGKIPVAAETFKSYPDTDDCEGAFEVYCNRPYGGLDDGYDALTWENSGEHIVGGWASHIQSGGFIKTCAEYEGDEWVQLMQIGSEDDAEFVWGDTGTLYFCIRLSDLKAKNFNNVKLDMECT